MCWTWIYERGGWFFERGNILYERGIWVYERENGLYERGATGFERGNGLYEREDTVYERGGWVFVMSENDVFYLLILCTKKPFPEREWLLPSDVLLSQGEAPYYHRR